MTQIKKLREQLFDEFCDILGVKLYPFQRQFILDKVLNQDKIYYTPFIPYRGSSRSFRELSIILSEFYKVPRDEVYLMLMTGEDSNE